MRDELTCFESLGGEKDLAGADLARSTSREALLNALVREVESGDARSATVAAIKLMAELAGHLKPQPDLDLNADDDSIAALAEALSRIPDAGSAENRSGVSEPETSGSPPNNLDALGPR